MVCSNCLRSLVVQAGTFTKKVKFNNIGRSLRTIPSRCISYSWNREFKANIRMMFDTGRVAAVVDMLPEKDDDGGFASGGWKR